MSTHKSIHIFKPGMHTAMSGAVLNFTEHDLADSAEAYDPLVHEAPMVVGHPKADAPAYGWVKSLQFAESGLHAEPDQVDAEFAELVRTGRFKKISASFYTPDSPSNPKPGVYYLRHVGFLGAQPPAIKGLKQAEFADAAEGIVEFSEWDDVQNASLWRNLREWFIGKHGQEEADKVVPQYAVQQLEQSAQQELMEDASEQNASPQPAFTETEGDTMSAEDKKRLAELETENARLRQQQTEFAESQKTALHTGNLNFAETLIKEGRLLPFQKELVVATLDFMASQEQIVEFGEGDGKKPLFDAVKDDWLAKAPKVVEFSEIGGDNDDHQTVDFAAPAGVVVDTAQLKLHNDATAYASTHNVDYQTALSAVSKRK
ncbi:MAG: hypothetical protein K9L79_00405 [Methylobacter tundripaludum]|nr:hypothetical protein [Methylobacter tundripaludum]